MQQFQFMDFHCHPNLKTFGHSFDTSVNSRRDIWAYNPPSVFTKLLNAIAGLSKFSQADLTSMSKGNVRVACVSFYPFEKNYFINKKINASFSARLADLITGVGYDRIRYIQQHRDYFTDLIHEMDFFIGAEKSRIINGENVSWQMVKNADEIGEFCVKNTGIAVIPTIEGAHILNTGLGEFGRPTDSVEVLRNVNRLKKLENSPFFITLAHNFNNDLCGHSPSLEKLGALVTQQVGMGKGFTNLGLDVVRKFLLPEAKGRPVYIDVKHMSVRARNEYFSLINEEFKGRIPIIVSHGAVAGQSLSRKDRNKNNFCLHDINFYDEELVAIADSGGIFSIQMDGNRLAVPRALKKSIRHSLGKNSYKDSAKLIWNQLVHVAETLDAAGLPSWNTCTIGSDFDGTINPLNGLWSAEMFPLLANELVLLASDYQKCRGLAVQQNRDMEPVEIVHRFTFQNGFDFIKKYYN